MAKKKMNVTEDDIRAIRMDLEYKIVTYLRERGWKDSCDYPDSCWRWEKAVPRKGETVTLTLSANGAFKVESNFIDVQ